MIKFIAEAGVNHNGSIENALKLIDIAKEAEADYVKFQTFKAEKLVTKSAAKAEYQILNTNNNEETQYEMLKKLELTDNDFQVIYDYCNKINIGLLSTPFDIESFKFLQDYNLEYIKISSGDLTNYPFLFQIASTGVKMIISTGMANMTEIKNAVGIIAAGYLGLQTPDISKLSEYIISADKLLFERLSILHCTTDYPANPLEINLASISYIKDHFNYNIGYSDHTTSLETPMYAVFAGANIIEKHFTIDKNMNGPDHKASLSPEELKIAINNVRIAETMLGKYEKNPTNAELKNIKIARKGMYALQNIKSGEILTHENVICKRPAFGKDNLNYWNIIGTKATKNYKINDEI